MRSSKPFVEHPPARNIFRYLFNLIEETVCESFEDENYDNMYSSSGSEQAVSKENIQNTIYSSEELSAFATSEIKTKLNKKRIKKQEKQMIDELCQSVIISTENKDWKDKIKLCIQDSSNIEGLYPIVEVQDLAAQHNLDLYSAALLYHSKKEV